MKTCCAMVDISSGAASRCENLCEGNTDYCARHNRERRKSEENFLKQSEKRKALLSKSKKVYSKPNKVSQKRETENQQYWIMRDAFLKERPKCEAKTETCTGESTDVHHMKGRGSLYLDSKYWLAVCQNCHIFITDHPLEAIKRNLSFSRLEQVKNVNS